MNIFVGNLSFDSTEEHVRRLFKSFGIVASAVIVMDKKGTRSRGFGFVQMPDEQQAKAAITSLNSKEFMGRTLNVSPARSQSEEGRNSGNQAKPRFNPVFERTGGYRGGRRTSSFMRRRAKAGIEEQVMPQKKNKENPMRWRKKQEQPKPWHKNREESKPWQKSEVQSDPWRKSSNRKKQSHFKGRKKAGGYKR